MKIFINMQMFFFNGRGNLSVQTFEALLDTFIFVTNGSIAKKKGIILHGDSIEENLENSRKGSFDVNINIGSHNKASQLEVSEENIKVVANNVMMICDSQDNFDALSFSKSDVHKLLLQGSFKFLLQHETNNNDRGLMDLVLKYKLIPSASGSLIKVLLVTAEYWLEKVWTTEEAISKCILSWIKSKVDYLCANLKDNFQHSDLIHVREEIYRSTDVKDLLNLEDMLTLNLLRSFVITAFANVVGSILLIFTSNPICETAVVVPLEVKTKAIMCVGYTCESWDKLKLNQLIRYCKRVTCFCGWHQSEGRFVYCNLYSCSCFKNGFKCTDNPICKCNNRVCFFYDQEPETKHTEPCKCGSSDPRSSLLKRCIPFSRCKCVKSKKSCSDCKCVGCDNIYGKREIDRTKTGNVSKRKSKVSERKKLSQALKGWTKKTDVDKYAECGLAIKDVTWFFSELVLLADLKRRIKSSSKLSKAYNHLIVDNQEFGRPKSEQEVESRAKFLSLL